MIDRLLGQGAMGSVYLGRDPELGRSVAIKTVREVDQSEEQKKTFLERFKNEARAAARLSHPSIVQVYDVGDDDQHGPYLVLEYVAGSTLKQIVRSRGALPFDEVLTVVYQLADASDPAHQAGSSHRDIQPDNVLMTEDGRAKLADFGVARVPDAALTREGQFLGTPCYSAPETLLSGRYSPRSDIFSLAAVAYELVAGVRAFPGDDALSVAHAVVNEKPSAPSEVGTRRVPRAVDAVILQGLAKEPEGRFGSAREFADALESAFGPSASRPDKRAEQRRSAPSFGWVIGAGLGLGVAAVFATTAPWSLSGDRSPDAGAPFVLSASAGDAASAPLFEQDAGVAVPDSGVDGGTGPDAGPVLSRLEREDAAQDAIDRARVLIAQGDRDAASRELERARQLDPESSDLQEVLAQLAALPE
ncbi:MAG: protein kinase [Kofleriaceae bacterium]|nr:protein kinase [Kofleriaceae bacterium]